ncbi:hypothetical protein JOF53_002055 [Crossiella equi]|uniref:Secreted protein n=1 Tax=Crossiella equi TaxID=130796 RepID=A0ABS5A9C4_9PSEU|nr:hypothetical protein [Crossiella equi]MBP2473183.1 hypothetical protein [Crossiella equi]
MRKALMALGLAAAAILTTAPAAGAAPEEEQCQLTLDRTATGVDRAGTWCPGRQAHGAALGCTDGGDVERNWVFGGWDHAQCGPQAPRARYLGIYWPVRFGAAAPKPVADLPPGAENCELSLERLPGGQDRAGMHCADLLHRVELRCGGYYDPVPAVLRQSGWSYATCPPGSSAEWVAMTFPDPPGERCQLTLDQTATGVDRAGAYCADREHAVSLSCHDNGGAASEPVASGWVHTECEPATPRARSLSVYLDEDPKATRAAVPVPGEESCRLSLRRLPSGADRAGMYCEGVPHRVEVRCADVMTEFPPPAPVVTDGWSYTECPPEGWLWSVRMHFPGSAPKAASSGVPAR